MTTILTADQQSGITNIGWTVYGKIKSITNSNGTISYNYNPASKRVSKTVNNVQTWYVRDAQNNALAIYDNAGGQIRWQEQDLYGSSRIGTWKPSVTLTPGAAAAIWDSIGHKDYELDDHLGNVLVTLTDKRIANGTDTLPANNYSPDINSVQYYFAFGMIVPHPTINDQNYRYGFNGKENDNEVKQEQYSGNNNVGAQQDYGERIYDPRIGRFLSVDPKNKSYPELTPYQFASDRPIDGLDRDGLEYLKSDEALVKFKQGLLELKVENFSYVNHNDWVNASQNPNNWTFTDGKQDIGISPVIGNFHIIGPMVNTPSLDNIPSEHLPASVTGQTETGIRSEAINRAGRREIARNGLMIEIPAGRGGVTKGAAVLDFLFFAFDSYKSFISYSDQDKIEDDTRFAKRAAMNVIRALNDGMIPKKYQNEADLKNIMNVVLEGANNTNNKDIYDLGIKIYKKYGPQLIKVKSGLDGGPTKTYTVPGTVIKDTVLGQ